jgi:hypothetical protein
VGGALFARIVTEPGGVDLSVDDGASPLLHCNQRENSNGSATLTLA